LLKKYARFCLEVGRLAIRRIVEGTGYELTGMDVIDAYEHFMAAAQTLRITSQARAARHGDETTRRVQQYSYPPVLGGSTGM
jgi:hypothetical protein